MIERDRERERERSGCSFIITTQRGREKEYSCCHGFNTKVQKVNIKKEKIIKSLLEKPSLALLVSGMNHREINLSLYTG